MKRNSIISIGVIFGVIVFGILVYVILFPGVGFKKDVSTKIELWGGYIYQQEYELIQDVFLIRPDADRIIDKDNLDNIIKSKMGSSKRLALTPEGSLYQTAGLYDVPNTIQQYERDPKGAAIRDYETFISVTDIVAIIRAGTRIRCSYLEKESGFSLWFGAQESVTYYATIVNGPYQGSKVEIEDLGTFASSKSKKGLILKKPDPRLLRLVKDNSPGRE